MYEWLVSAQKPSTVVLTVNRRLARRLLEAYGAQQVEAGQSAWMTPRILTWHDWLQQSFSEASEQNALPTRINNQHAQVLWERALSKEYEPGGAGLGTGARMCREAWQRSAESLVAIKDIARTARSPDQRLFATVAGRYLATLDQNGWLDAAGLVSLVPALYEEKRIPVPRQIILAGFDRVPSALKHVCRVLEARGCAIKSIPATEPTVGPDLPQFESVEQEMRAAGAWAREQLLRDPSASVAIVRQGLENSVERDLRLVREGAVPGWQYGDATIRNKVNVSYGGRLSEYPAIHVALLALRWLSEPLASREVALLLLSPLVGGGGEQGRSRLELQLRELPDRSWSPAMVSSALSRQEGDESGSDWLQRVAWLSKRRRECPATASPLDWVLLFDETLNTLGWPGASALDSKGFQLVNRWRELLNEFARLDLVAPRIGVSQAVRRLEHLATETVFQPESDGDALQLLGPLEAAGGEYDAIWISGVTTSDWPAATNPNTLIARSLQIERQMPDATPADSLLFARSTFKRLVGSAPKVVCSFATSDDGVEQTASELLREYGEPQASVFPDPQWHTLHLSQTGSATTATDSVPPLESERLFGGAATIEKQMSDPFSAFAQGRLGVRWLGRQAIGITPQLRGNVLHDALYRLYSDLPSRTDIVAWDSSERHTRAESAVAAAIVRHERNTDAVLAALLRLERARLTRLIESFVALDAARDDFVVAAVEGKFEFIFGNVRLSLRFDRVDRYADNCISILDYKSGLPRTLVQKNGEVREPQLFVYAMAADAEVASLALINIDSKEINISGAGRGFSEDEVWEAVLDRVRNDIIAACRELESGDVRLNAGQTLLEARGLNLLSRYSELVRER